jgi:predicted Zn-dependent peptidase
MMNTIEYRVDCQLLQHLHWDNNLGCRFPIGKLDQVVTWDAAKVRQFHERWYFPANATLYVVGDFHADVPGVVEMIENAFGAASAATHPEGFVNEVPRSPDSVKAFEGVVGGAGAPSLPNNTPDTPNELRDRHAVRPPVKVRNFPSHHVPPSRLRILVPEGTAIPLTVYVIHITRD